VLGVMESKLGGLPYCEGIEDWKQHGFLEQIDLHRATAVLPEGAPKLSGLLSFDAAFDERLLRVRWFLEPSADRAIARRPREALWPLREPAWFGYEAFYPSGYNMDDRDDFHRLLGHKSSPSPMTSKRAARRKLVARLLKVLDSKTRSAYELADILGNLNRLTQHFVHGACAKHALDPSVELIGRRRPHASGYRVGQRAELQLKQLQQRVGLALEEVLAREVALVLVVEAVHGSKAPSRRLAERREHEVKVQRHPVGVEVGSGALR
jgi:hypothetical protein